MTRGHKSKLQRKAARLEQNEKVTEFRRALGEPIRKRDRKLFEATKIFNETLKEAREQLARDRKEAYDDYKNERDVLIKKYASKEEEETTSATGG